MSDLSYVTIECDVKAVTEKSVKIAVNDEEMWVPRSLLSTRSDIALDDRMPSELETLEIMDWKAKELGL